LRYVSSNYPFLNLFNNLCSHAFRQIGLGHAIAIPLMHYSGAQLPPAVLPTLFVSDPLGNDELLYE